jgi:hypothetical protein
MEDWDDTFQDTAGAPAFREAALQYIFKEGFVTKSNKMTKEAEAMAAEYMRLLVVEAVHRSVAVAKSEQLHHENIARAFDDPSEHVSAFDESQENNDPDEITFNEDPLNESVATQHRRKNKVVTITPANFQKIMTQLMMDFH